LPYVSIGIESPEGDEFEVSGIGIIEYWGDGIGIIEYWGDGMKMISEFDSNSGEFTGDWTGDSPEADVPLRAYMLMLGALMVMVSPLVFLLSAIVGGVFTFSSGVLPKTLGKLHLGFFVVMILMIMIGGTIMSDIFADNEPELPSSMLGFTGIGIWIGGLSGIGFFYDRDELSKLDNDSTTGGIIIDGSLKLIQNPVKSPGELSDEHRKVGSKCSELECKSTVMYKSKFCYKHRNIE
jgi:hypothetical protein